MHDGSCGSYNWRATKHYKNQCYFCKEEIPCNGSCSPNGGFLDRIDCQMCRTPVCDKCGITTIAQSPKDEDTKYRIRICNICQQKDILLRTTQVPQYCMECETRHEKEVFQCICGRTVCADCRVILDGKTLCKECGKTYQETAAICHSCGKNLYAFQVDPRDRYKKDHYKICRGCGNKFCPTCCTNLRIVKNKIDRVCNECASKYTNPSPDTENPTKDNTPTVFQTFIGKAKQLFKKD